MESTLWAMVLGNTSAAGNSTAEPSKVSDAAPLTS